MNASLDLSPIKQIPIVEVAKQLGIEVRGGKAMCFMGHDRASPSLSFLKSDNTWRCFGACGKHGDAITLVMEREGLNFKSAIEWFAQKFDVHCAPQHRARPRLASSHGSVKLSSPTKAAPKPHEFMADSALYEWLLNKCAKVSSAKGLNYLATHGISIEAAERFNIRELRDPRRAYSKLIEKWGPQRVYASGIANGRDGCPRSMVWGSYSLLFPCYEAGKIVCIQARSFDGRAKFLNLRGVPKPIYNVDKLRGLKPGQLVHICEGAPDATALESHGLVAVGILGATSFRPDWVDLFLKFTVVVLGDGDVAGSKFAKDISHYFIERGKSVKCMPLPEGQDVSDVLAQAWRTK